MIRVFFALAIFIALLVLLAFVVRSALKSAKASSLSKKFAKEASKKFAVTIALARRFKMLSCQGKCWRGAGSGGGKISCQTCTRHVECERAFLHEWIANVADRVRGMDEDAFDFAWEFCAAVEDELLAQQLGIKLAELQMKLDQMPETKPSDPQQPAGQV